MYIGGSEEHRMEQLLERDPGPHTSAAQIQLGHIERRKGNEAAAAAWFALAAWRGNGVGMFSLGQSCMMERHIEAGFRWFYRSSARKCAAAQHALGQAHRLGIHNVVNDAPTPDDEAARKWFEAAATNGCVKSQHMLDTPAAWIL